MKSIQEKEILKWVYSHLSLFSIKLEMMFKKMLKKSILLFITLMKLLPKEKKESQKETGK